MNIAYVRVSCVDQNPARQFEILKDFNIEKYYEEKQSGKDAERPQLKEMLTFARNGDTIYVESFSRLARNTRDLLFIVDILKKKEVKLISLKEQIDTSTANGQFMLTIFGALAELERATTRERQLEGIAAAKKRGKHIGRPPAQITPEYRKAHAKWKAGECTAVAAMKSISMKPNTFYNLDKRMNQTTE